jgi:hypothetical protein
MCDGLRFLDRPVLVEHFNLKKISSEVPLASGALNLI